MKLRLAQILCLFILSNLSMNAQATRTIDVELQEVNLSEALKVVEDKGGIHILFDYDDVDGYNVTCLVKDITVEEAMDVILFGKQLTYEKVRENTYVVKKEISVSSLRNTESHISGFVTDSLNIPVVAAVVSTVNPQTGISIEQCITDGDGRFHMKADGNIQLYVSCLGYTPFLSVSFCIENDTILNIKLQSSSILLDDVLVVGEKQSPAVRVINGNTVFFPKNSAVLAGSSALDVLKKTPGIFVDGNNNISVGGRNSVLVIFNGKPTYMKHEELVSILKSMPSSSIMSIEIIDNPSVQYDAEGSGGIININTQRQILEGYYFSMNNGFSYWNNPRQNTELSFSFTKKKFSLIGNYHHQFGYYDLYYGMHRIQSGKDFYSPTEDTDKRKSITGNLDFEYKPNDKNIIGGQITANALFGPGQTTTITEIRDLKTNDLEQILYAKNEYYMQKGNRYGANLYYISNPKEDVKYTVDANYAWFDGGSGNLQPNTYKLPNGKVLNDYLYKSVNGRNIHIFALSYNQQHKLGNGVFKSGIKFSNVNADNMYKFFEIKNNNEIIDRTQSNDFTYKERILAAYMLYSYPLSDNLNTEVGIRGEQTWSEGNLYTVDGINNKENERSYFDIFPSVNLNYKIGEEHSLSLGYGSRIDRPAYQDLNPFEYLLDELSYWKGNPFLKPQKTHVVSASYNYKKTYIDVSYSYMKDYKAQITDTLSINKVVMSPMNIGKQQQVSLTLNQVVSFVKWWDMNFNLVAYYTNRDMAFDTNRRFEKDGFAGIITLMNTFRLPWKIQMELNGAFVTRRLGDSNERMEPTGYMDLALGRSFLKKRLSVNISFTDMFWTNNWDNYRTFGDFQLWNWGKGESRQIKINISYHFGKEKNKSHELDFKELDRL